MEVELNPGRMVNTGINQPVARQQSTQPAENTMSFERIQALETNLKETAQIRPEAVARANALVSDPSYPSDESLNKIAGILAKHIQDQPD
jgi:hypothetical protein